MLLTASYQRVAAEPLGPPELLIARPLLLLVFIYFGSSFSLFVCGLRPVTRSVGLGSVLRSGVDRPRTDFYCVTLVVSLAAFQKQTKNDWLAEERS